VLAFAVDYLVIAAYLVVLLVASLAIMASNLVPAWATLWSSAWSAELTQSVLLTLPVVFYFALFESSPGGATLGKRALRIRVRAADGQRLGLDRALLRSVVKFLPWELAHFTIWHLVYATASHRNPPTWTALTLATVYLLVALFLVTLFVGRSHRTMYDRFAGSRVDLVANATRH